MESSNSPPNTAWALSGQALGCLWRVFNTHGAGLSRVSHHQFVVIRLCSKAAECEWWYARRHRSPPEFVHTQVITHQACEGVIGWIRAVLRETVFTRSCSTPPTVSTLVSYPHGHTWVASVWAPDHVVCDPNLVMPTTQARRQLSSNVPSISMHTGSNSCPAALGVAP